MLGQEKIMAAANMDTEMVFPNRLLFFTRRLSVHAYSKHKMNG